MGSDELFVTYLNDSDKIGKPIKNYLDLFINTSLNHVSITSRLVSQPNEKLKLNGEQVFNTTDVSPITFGVILPSKPRGKNSTNSHIIPVNSDEKKILKYVLSKLC